MDQHSFQEDRMNKRQQLLFCSCCCFLDTDFSTGVTWTTCAAFIGLRCSRTQHYGSVSYIKWSLSCFCSDVVTAWFLSWCSVSLQQHWPDTWPLSAVQRSEVVVTNEGLPPKTHTHTHKFACMFTRLHIQSQTKRCQVQPVEKLMRSLVGMP